MGARYLAELSTPSVRTARKEAYGMDHRTPQSVEAEALGEDERAFIAARDSFYLATVGEGGWPYVQHRGGPAGFLHVLSPTRLGFADLAGNRQLLSTGNVAANDKVSLLLVDYPNRARLKILGRATVVPAREDRALADSLAPSPERRKRVERSFLIDVVGFDWNCPLGITPRFTEDEVRAYVAPLHQRIAELEKRVR